MYKDILKSIAGIEIYPLISFGIFFIFFIALLLYVVLVNKNHIKAMAQMPLSNEESSEANSSKELWS